MLIKAYEMFKDRGVNFLGVNIWDKEEQSRKFVQERGISYAVGYDQGDRIARLYGIQGTPTTFLLARDGTVAAIARGRMKLESLTAVLEELLKKGP